MPPNDTNKSTQPKRTSRLYRMMGHVKYSMLTYVSSGFDGSAVLKISQILIEIRLKPDSKYYN